MARVYHWRKPPRDRFVHLFLQGQRTSLCERVQVAGQKVKDYEPGMRRGARALGKDILLCPHCRRIGELNGE